MPVWIGDSDDTDPHVKTPEEAIKQAKDLWDELDEIDKRQASTIVERILRMCDESPEAVRGMVNAIGAVVEMNYLIAKQVQDLGVGVDKEGPLIRRYWQQAMYALVISPQAQAVMHRIESIPAKSQVPTMIPRPHE